jgi:hypothetical protein
MIRCRNENCKKLLLPWSQESHLAVCKHTEVECFLCDSLLSLDTLIEHIKAECDKEWLAKAALAALQDEIKVANQERRPQKLSRRRLFRKETL